MATSVHTVTLIPGDSLGPELSTAMQRVVAATGVTIEWVPAEAGLRAYEQHGDALPAATVDSIRKTKIALRGRIITPEGGGYKSPNVRLRRDLGLYAVVRPIHNLPGLPARFSDIDIIIVREGTEDIYGGIEHEVVPGVTQSVKITTRPACLRICRFAFEFAKAHGRERITLVHKANIMKQSDGLFMRCGEEIAADYPDIEYDTIIADNACMQMVRDPGQFDVMLSMNLFGDILSDLGAGLVGGIGAVWGELHGEEGVHVFEVLHGLAPGLEGRGKANPLPFLLPARAMLTHLGEEQAADKLSTAISEVLAGDGTAKTPDLGGTATTDEMVDALIASIRRG